jgi:hypothetical protein
MAQSLLDGFFGDNLMFTGLGHFVAVKSNNKYLKKFVFFC